MKSDWTVVDRSVYVVQHPNLSSKGTNLTQLGSQKCGKINFNASQRMNGRYISWLCWCMIIKDSSDLFRWYLIYWKETKSTTANGLINAIDLYSCRCFLFLSFTILLGHITRTNMIYRSYRFQSKWAFRDLSLVNWEAK